MEQIEKECYAYPEHPGNIKQKRCIADLDIGIDVINQARQVWHDRDQKRDCSSPVLFKINPKFTLTK